jgi:hypothetical protein
MNKYYGEPCAPVNITLSKNMKKSPARARRSRFRLEEFINNKKVN